MNRARTDPIRLAVLNYADVRNFGDVLFPLVVARELDARIAHLSVDFVTPTGSSWAGMDSIRLDRADLAGYDAIVLGGGEIVHRADDMLVGIYSLFGLECVKHPTDLVFSWCDAPGFKAWLSLGVPEPSGAAQRATDVATPTLDYVSARGSSSAARLTKNGGPTPVLRTPDLGWLFPRLLLGRAPPAHPAGGASYLTLHALGFGDLDGTLAALRRVSQVTGLKIVLMPLTRCWRDVLPLSVLHQASRGEFFIVDDDMADLDKLAILGGAQMFVGQSLHGFIGTLGQGRPAGLCMYESDDKFSELLRDMDLQHFRWGDWNGLESLVLTLLQAPRVRLVEQLESAQSQLDAVFDDLADRIVAHRARSSSAPPAVAT